MCRCQCCQEPAPRRRFRPIALLVNLALAYLLLVVGGGTLINTGHPVATEAGRLLHTVTFVHPTITWADARGYEPLAHGLRVVANGIPIPSFG
ncbi:MAG: hypothetical protein ACYS0G_08880 [Planctomycetota bacterium]|jgi:hypothetical protein